MPSTRLPLDDGPCRGRLFRADSVASSLGVYLPSTAAAKAVGLARGVVLAWFLQTSEYGLLMLALQIACVLTPVGSLNLSESLARYVPMHETRGTLLAFLRRAWVLVAAVGLAMTGMLVAAAPWLGLWLFAAAGSAMSTAAPEGVSAGEAAVLTRWLAGNVFAVVVYFGILSVFKGLRMFRAVSAMELVNAVLFTVFALAGVGLGPRTALVVVIAHVAANVVSTLLFAVPLAGLLPRLTRQHEALAPGESVGGRMLRYSVWAALAALMWQLLLAYPSWYLNRVHGHDAMGVFGSVRFLGQTVWMIAFAVTTVVMTWVTKVWEAHGREAADRRFLLSFKATTLGLLVLAGVLAAGRGALIRLFPAAYAAGEAALPATLAFYVAAGALSFLAIHYSLIEKTSLLFLPWVSGVAANVLFAWLWVLRGEGAPTPMKAQILPSAWASAAAAAVALAVSLAVLRLKRRPVDRGSRLLCAASFALCLPTVWMAAIVALVTLLCRPLVFTSEEAAELRGAAGRLKARLSTRRPSTEQ